MLSRAYLSKGTALEVLVHRRRPGWDNANRFAATLSLTSSPPRERERSTFCCRLLHCHSSSLAIELREAAAGGGDLLLGAGSYTAIAARSSSCSDVTITLPAAGTSFDFH